MDGQDTHQPEPRVHVEDRVSLVLRRGETADDLRLARVGATGEVTDPFHVPEGRALVVTDVAWHYEHGGSAGRMQVLSLTVGRGEDSAGAQAVFVSPVMLDGTGQGGTSHALATGFAVSSQARLGVALAPGPLGPPPHGLRFARCADTWSTSRSTAVSTNVPPGGARSGRHREGRADPQGDEHGGRVHMRCERRTGRDDYVVRRAELLGTGHATGTSGAPGWI